MHSVHSEQESFRATLRTRTLDGEPHTVIVLRRRMGGQAWVWLTLNGAWKITLRLTDADAAQLTQAQRPPRSSGSST
ncbi:MAG: hypothetical protein ACRDTF_18200 [Pseudonocardiaceae bacterium]